MIVVPSAAELSNKRREGSVDFVGEGFSVTLAGEVGSEVRTRKLKRQWEVRKWRQWLLTSLPRSFCCAWRHALIPYPDVDHRIDRPITMCTLLLSGHKWPH